MIDPISIPMLIFAGVSATNALFDLFKRWRNRMKEKAGKGCKSVEHAFSNVPRVLQDTLNACTVRAHAFELGDVVSRLNISMATKRFQRTLNATLQLALNGQSLDLVKIRNVVDGYGQEVVGALGALFKRVQSLGPHQESWSKSLDRKDLPAGVERAIMSIDSRSGSVDSLVLNDQDGAMGISTYGEISVPALRPLESNTTALAETLKALQRDCSLQDFQQSLEQELDIITSRRPNATSAVLSAPVCMLDSWQVLDGIMTRAGISKT